MEEDENSDLKGQSGKCRSKCVQVFGHYPAIYWLERMRKSR